MKTKMNIEALGSNVYQWSSARGILEQSTFDKQMKKYDEEKLEMMDAIGDQVVCLLNASFLAGSDESKLSRVRSKVSQLKAACEILGVEFDECLGMAWEEIKWRKGLMIDGFYVKYSDLDAELQALCDASQ